MKKGKQMGKAPENQQGVSRRNFLSGSAVVGSGLLAAKLGASSTHAATPTLVSQLADLPRVTQELVAPPFAPKHQQVASGGPKIVEIRMVLEEKIMVLDDDGAEIWSLIRSSFAIACAPCSRPARHPCRFAGRYVDATVGSSIGRRQPILASVDPPSQSGDGRGQPAIRRPPARTPAAARPFPRGRPWRRAGR